MDTEAVDLPEDLKTALHDVLEQSEIIKPGIEYSLRWQLSHWLKHLVKEATNPEEEMHCWETTLDLWNKAARQAGEAGTAFLEASARLAPLMMERLGPYTDVTLREIDEDTMWGVCLLSETLTPPKKYMVAPNVYSLAEAHFNPHAWFRAIYAGKAPVGFVMIVDDAETPEYFIWRYMIAEPFHGRGYGAQAMQRLIEYVRTRPNATELLLSCGEGEGSPEGFYRKMGFERTGDVLDDEVVMKINLVQTP